MNVNAWWDDESDVYRTNPEENGGWAWWSADGMIWFTSDGIPCDGDEFHAAAITLIDGPQDGQVVA